jgi:excisionase family DNA binding protein
MEHITEALAEQGKKLQRIEELLFNQKKVLNLAEVCQMTGLSKSHLYKLTCYGRIPHYKQSKHLFFQREEMEAWLLANRQPTTQELEAEAANSIGRKGGEK